MLLQTNSYTVPKEKRAEHARLMKRFRQTLGRLGCEDFEVYEQVGTNWNAGKSNGRFVQIMRFRDRRHHQAIQTAERTDPAAQDLIREFCALVDFPYQQEQGLFAVGFYNGVLTGGGARAEVVEGAEAADGGEAASSGNGDRACDATEGGEAAAHDATADETADEFGSYELTDQPDDDEEAPRRV